MREDEFEILCTIIEHLEAVEESAYNIFSYYFDNQMYDKALVFEGLSCRVNLEIQLLENYIHEYRRREREEE